MDKIILIFFIVLVLIQITIYDKNYKLSMEGKSYNELEYIKES